MDRKLGALLSLGVLFSVSLASGQMLGTPARQQDAGSLTLLTYYQGVQDQTVRFDVAGTGDCASKGGPSFACNQTGSVDASGQGGMGVVKLVYQPWDYIQYYGSIGVGNYALSVPSETVTNQLSGDNPGVEGALGLRATIYPETIVTPAIAVDGSLSGSRYDFNRMTDSNGVAQTVNQTLTMWQYQVAVETSKRFAVEESVTLEPYGGVKWVRTQSDLLDHQSGSHAGGQLDTVTPFLGLRIPATKHELFFAEASFVDAYQYAAGLSIGF